MLWKEAAQGSLRPRHPNREGEIDEKRFERAATTHGTDRHIQLPNQTLAPSTNHKRQAMQSKSVRTRPYALGIPNLRFMTHYTSSKQCASSVYFAVFVVACTTLVPSTNRVLYSRFAFSNMPSFRLTTMNCEPLNRVLIK